jgi:hypothetical protein
MRTVTFTREDGSESLLTEYETGELTLAERAHSWESWGPPISGVVSEPYNYVMERRIEDVISEGWRGL